MGAFVIGTRYCTLSIVYEFNVYTLPGTYKQRTFKTIYTPETPGPQCDPGPTPHRSTPRPAFPGALSAPHEKEGGGGGGGARVLKASRCKASRVCRAGSLNYSVPV